MKILLFILLFLLAFTSVQNSLYASKDMKLSADAFGQPGLRPNWASAKNVQVGTFYERPQDLSQLKSLVWFTNASGMLTEVFFPTIDIGQIKDAQLLISDGTSFFHSESNDLIHEVEVVNPSKVILKNSDPLGRYQISHHFFTLKDSSTIIDEVTVETFVDGLSFYHLTNPHLQNTGYKDAAFIYRDGFLVREDSTYLTIKSSIGYSKRSVGFVGQSDGFQDLNNDLKMDYTFSRAFDGNVATTGKLNISSKKGKTTFYLIYQLSQSEAKPPKHHVKQSYQAEASEYHQSWSNYFTSLKKPKFSSKQQELLYYRSMYTLKTHEDKLNPGALIASLSIPWGEKQFEYESSSIGGYHLIWPRDLYHVALAMLYSGESQSTLDALHYLKKIQYTQEDGNWYYTPRIIPKAGAFPQNTWVNGADYWSGLQLDQVGYPIHLFYQYYLSLETKTKKQELLNEFSSMLLPALEFIKNYGPWTAQERWEENFGISPSSFAVATSALKIGSILYPERADYASTADTWLNKPGDNIETWTFTENGLYGNGKYYLRFSGCTTFETYWNPNDNQDCHIANSSIRKDQRLILDQGFLKLSLLGLKPGSDWKIKNSLEILNQHIKVQTPRSFAWYRYSFDAYGEDGIGRLWPILSSEHGRFAIERFQANDLSWPEAVSEVDEILASYQGYANDGLMIPEQIFEATGLGTGAATPLAWSHAEFIKLLWSKSLGYNIENPFK